jgi:TRAP-type C4-dicarboxylate transport system permease small subunit
MRWFLFWVGGVIMVMILAIIFAGGLYQKHRECEQFQEIIAYPELSPETTVTPIVPEWYIQADCHGVQNDLYLSYYVLAIGAALIGIGFVVR